MVLIAAPSASSILAYTVIFPDTAARTQLTATLAGNPALPLPAADPSPTGAPHVRTAQTTPALAGRCAALPAASADRIAWCGRLR
ncbi:MAG: hypothetical protein ACTHPS_01485 [Streptosporangiaceae bacterium]